MRGIGRSWPISRSFATSLDSIQAASTDHDDLHVGQLAVKHRGVSRQGPARNGTLLPNARIQAHLRDSSGTKDESA